MHHDKYQYEKSFIYKLYERKWAKFVDYTKFRSKVAAIIFFTGTIMLTVGAIVSMKVLASAYIFILVFLLPSCATSVFSRKELFFSLDANIVGNRVYARGLPRWTLWGFTIFVNLITVGSASLLLFSITCITLADNTPSEQKVYVKEISIDKNNGKTAHIVFEDGTKTAIHGIQHKGNDWKDDTYKTILVKNTIFNIRILAE